MTTFTSFLEFVEEDTGVKPALVWAICGACHGDGASSAYLGAYTQADMAEMDDEWREDYFTGRFDQPCEECDGTGKVRELPEGSDLEAEWAEWCAEEAADRAVRRAESGYQW